MAWQGLTAAGPAEEGMALVRGDEAPGEIILLAYGMEEGLRGFYESMASRIPDQAVKTLFSELAVIEDRHKKRLFEVYAEHEPSAGSVTDFEGRVVVKAMEGGLTTEEFLARNKPVLKTTHEVLEVAMTIETQALDLYLRYSDRSRDKKTQTALFEIAEEEKGHLEALGRLMDEGLKGADV